GPSGAGKDTLIAAAAERLAQDSRFVFPRRLVTRTADPALEPHATIDRADFERMRREGAVTLAWEAHGLGYVIPRMAAENVARGRIAVCNASRRVLADAAAAYQGVAVVVVEAARE